ncbi:MAG: TusE/DsrC/DsvC family sulfur relay protein, partial [Gammaproteobacteria bacterium]|nr:TusE/DsrC/DsvC family sulfur relay protein [Gammaproteobacteria bacterium]
METAIKTDNEGFLLDHTEWSMEFLKQVADEDDVNVTMDHVD